MHIPAALRYRRYRLLWLGLMLSMAGSQMQVVAIHWHIRDLTGVPNPLALGGIGLARILPVIVFSLIAGVVADTFNRRRVLFITQTILALVALALAWLTFRGHITIWQIYALTAIQATAFSFDMPARAAIIPNLVPAQDLPSAFSMNSIAFNVGAVLGPLMSGIVIAGWGIGYTYLINAISFLAVIVALILIGQIPQQVLPSSQAKMSLEPVKQGLQFILSQPIILSTMLLDFFATFFSSANTMMPIVARDILKVGETGFGLLSAAQSIGAVLAAVVVSQIKTIRKQGLVFMSSVVVFGLTTIGFGMAKNFVLVMQLLILMGSADAVSTILRNTIRQLQTPDYLRGRMTSINQIFFQGGPQLGEVEAGIVATLFSVPISIITGGIGCIVAVFVIGRRWPEIVRYNGDEPTMAGATAQP
jgi:MFS family permease